MRRRALLASTAAATAVGTAGCIATLGSSTVDAGDTVTLNGVEFELGALRVQSTFVDQKWPYWDAQGSRDRVYATIPLAPTDGEGGAQEAVRNAAVAAERDGERVSDPESVLTNRDDQPPLLVGVPFPTGTRGDEAAVVFGGAGGAQYPLDDEQRAYVADPPELSVEARIPEESTGDVVTVGLDVTNDDDRDAVLAWTTTHAYVSDAWWTYRSTIPAGEQKTLRQPFDRIGDPDPGTDLGIRLDWGYDERDTDVRITEK